ncbi:MAG: 1-propanol dehydrogenase PduQ [Arachnia sp.]
MNRFKIATTILQGADSLKGLEDIGARRVLLVTDPFLVKSHAMTKILEYLGPIDVTIFDEVFPDPSVKQVTAAFAAFMQMTPDTIIALGGGSALDTAKAVYKLAWERETPPSLGFVAIPSTSGSGSEVTSFAVVTADGHKVVLVSDDMAPTMAILDPEVTRSLPPAITADTGMDAITHALEAYVSTGRSDFSDAFAEKAAQLACQNLETAVRHGDDLIAREKMHNAATMAAVAFNNSGLGITHSLSHALGAKFHKPHGRLNAVLLPTVMEFNAGPVSYGSNGISTVAGRYAHIAHLLGLEAASRRNLALSLCAELRRLRRSIDIPDTLSGMGVDPTELKDCAQELAEAAMEDACTPSNPVQPTVSDLRSLLHAVA